MSATVIWILFAVACGIMMIAGLRAKHQERTAKSEKEHRPRQAA